MFLYKIKLRTESLSQSIQYPLLMGNNEDLLREQFFNNHTPGKIT